jgi:hypothetical protein
MRPRIVRRREPLFEPLEGRLCLANSVGWDGSGRGSAALTYYIANAPGSLSQATVDDAITNALSAWSAVVDITFTETSQPNRVNSLDFSFRAIDGAGSTLAAAYLPDDVSRARVAGDVRFDASEEWEVGNALGASAVDLVHAAVHEIGHALGLNHSEVAGSVMAATVSSNRSFTGLSAADVQSIRALYAPANSAMATPTIDTTISSTIILPRILGVGSIRSNGIGRTAVVVGFAGPMDPGRVTDLGIYHLANIRMGRRLASRSVRVVAASYDPESYSVTLTLKRPFKAGKLQLRVDAAGVVAADGASLVGGDFVAIVPR